MFDVWVFSSDGAGHQQRNRSRSGPPSTQFRGVCDLDFPAGPPGSAVSAPSPQNPGCTASPDHETSHIRMCEGAFSTLAESELTTDGVGEAEDLLSSCLRYIT